MNMPVDEFKKRYEEEGAVWPISVLNEEELLAARLELDRASKELDLMNSDYRCKAQVLFPWVASIARSPKLTPYLTAVLGDSYHCWDALFWIKSPGDGKYVSFHQDGTYWNFLPKKGVTVWLSFDGATEDSGAIQYVLGSHKSGIRKHTDKRNDRNLLMRGQTVDRAKEEARQTVVAEVPAGFASLHAPFVVHGSTPNRSVESRAACGLIFVSGEAAPILSHAPESTLWVQGVDSNRNFLHDPVPAGAWEADKANWRKAYDRQHENYYRMSLTDV
jgi:non-heme Fe2+,alpha-ketoglutarate-dependent halogenase